MKNATEQLASLKAGIFFLESAHSNVLSAMTKSYRALAAEPTNPTVVEQHKKAVRKEISVRNSLDEAKQAWSSMLATMAFQVRAAA
jgi:hypothetical protein